MQDRFRPSWNHGFTPLKNRFVEKSILYQREARKDASLTGFTLPELLIVIAIIALLASILYAKLGTNPLIKSRDAKRATDIGNLHKALALYLSDKRFYPATSDLASELKNSGYIAEMPRDPRETSGTDCPQYTPNYVGGDYATGTLGTYGYRYIAVTSAGAVCTTALGNCTSYVLQACMENGDPASNSALQSSCSNAFAIPPCAPAPIFTIHS